MAEGNLVPACIGIQGIDILSFEFIYMVTIRKKEPWRYYENRLNI